MQINLALLLTKKREFSMRTEANITINDRKYTISVQSFGDGSIPIIILGHAEIYARLLENAFSSVNLLRKYRFFVPITYWCDDAPLASLEPEILSRLTLNDMIRHIDEIRVTLAEKQLLHSVDNKVGIYSHSFFSALAFHYAATFPQNTLFIEAEGPPPYNTANWAKEKTLFFKGNASLDRKQALAQEGIDPGGSAVDEKSMNDFSNYRDNYHRMNPTLWQDYTRDYRETVWGDKKLNMLMMRRYLELLREYDAQAIIPHVNCPVHFTLGIFDTPVPPYLWIDSPAQGGIGFFDRKPTRDYYIHTHSGHWPYTEEPEESCKQFDAFIQEIRPKL